MEPAAKRLTKSRTDRMIDGVCGGIAAYYGLDPTLVRLAWVLLVFLGGSGILLYIVAMIIMPAGELQVGTAPTAVRAAGASSRFWGILLVALGMVWLLHNLDLDFWHSWWWFRWDSVLPVLLILAGVGFLFGGRNYISTATPVVPAGAGADAAASIPPQTATQPPRPARLYKSRREKKIFGVCGGIAAYAGIDPTIVRLLFVVMAFASFGLALLLYVVMAIVVPEEPLITHAV